MTNWKAAPRRVAVLGGGISGLTAAYTLAKARSAGAPVQELLIEGGDRLGGLIRTEQVEGFVVEAGPDSFVAEKPEAASLCGELGLGDSLMGSNDVERRTYILHQSRLVPLPDGLLLFVPTRVWPVLRSPLFPLPSKLAVLAERFRIRRGTASVDRVKPSQQVVHEDQNQAGDESVASFVRRHFGSEMVENVVDPLLAGIFGGDSACLSVRSTLPRLREMEQEYGSLTFGARQAKRRGAGAGPGMNPAPLGGPLFMTLRDGLQTMVERLRGRLENSRVYLGQRVIAIERVLANDVGGSDAPDSVAPTYSIRCHAGTTYDVDAIILALPTYECSRLLAPFDAALADNLAAVPYSSALTVALGCNATASGSVPSGFGFLVPRREKRRLLACTFVHRKFAHRAPPRCVLLRCFLGGVRDPEVLRLSDGEIVAIVRQELQTILHLSAVPLFHCIYRWPASMPQYVVGHEERTKAIQRQLENHSGLFLAGNAYGGIGISDCIRSGKAAAMGALQSLTGKYASASPSAVPTYRELQN